MRLRPERSLVDLRELVRQLEMELGNFASWSAGPDKSGLYNTYLSWMRKAEESAFRFLLDVPKDQFVTVRWQSVLAGTVPPERLYAVVEADAKAQLDWLTTTLQDLERLKLDLDGGRIWHAGMLRLFVSHLARERAYAAQVSRELERFGVQGFVAHESIEVSREWQEEIEYALETAHAFLGLVHPGFTESAWTQQEVGWARARKMPLFLVLLGEDPKGFPAKIQFPSMSESPVADVAATVSAWLTSNEEIIF